MGDTKEGFNELNKMMMEKKIIFNCNPIQVENAEVTPQSK
jgi:hypothetical protein